jgi:hypothetical protein
VPLQQVVGDGLATLATQLTEHDERAVEAELVRLLAVARAKQIGSVTATGVQEAHVLHA